MWKEGTIRGSMILALLSETAVAMARYEMKDRIERRTVDFKTKKYPVKLSTESIVWSLGHLTVMRIISNGMRKTAYFSNWDAVSREIFDNIRRDCGGNPAVSA